MDADRPGDSLMDPAVDRELQAMLAVDPSSDFMARVRTRIADERQPSAWWLSWKFAGVATMAAIVVLAVVMLRPREAVRPLPVARRGASPDAARPTPSAAATAQEPRTGTVKSPAEAGHHVRTTKAGQHILARPAAPKLAGNRGERRWEVLIDARESAALRSLILGARDGRVNLDAVLRAATPSPMDLPPIGAIDIPFLTIEPIAPGTGEEGVRQ
jgi:hypothetical protein